MSRKGMEKMNFQERLNNYIIQIRCNGKELARNSEISEPVFNSQKLDILLRELDINISRIAAFCIMIRPTCQR